VYQLNKYCFTEFVRSNDDLKVDHKFMIPLFNWNNEKKGISFELFENKFMVEDKDHMGIKTPRLINNEIKDKVQEAINVG